MSSDGVNVLPLGKRVVVKPQEIEETTSGGLIIPPTAQDGQKPELGEVVKLGTGESDFEFSVKLGDKVFFKKYSPDEIEVEGQTYYILSEEDVLAILK